MFEPHFVDDVGRVDECLMAVNTLLTSLDEMVDSLQNSGYAR